ncbi:geranylgeranylglycerol-phosphate geranylgeranyltransferase [bacterium]|nr:geranylgeranylglycerol-phosphate geranylgeranyltransferase [bacterium]
MRTIVGFYRLLRPGNMAITGLSVAVGALGCRGPWCPERIACAAASAMLLAGGGNALNDCHDLAIDRINRPRRPLPAGLVTPEAAALAGTVMMTAGVGIGFVAGAGLGLLAAAGAVLLWAYAAHGKRMALAGNLLVAVVAGSAFFYGGLAVGNWRLATYPAGFALLMHLAREIVKDVQDEPGDRAAGARTTAIALGKRRSLAVAAAALGLLFLLTALPYLLGAYNRWYLLLALALVNPFLLWAVRELLSDPGPQRIARLSLLIKLDMVAGLAAIAAGILIH